MFDLDTFDPVELIRQGLARLAGEDRRDWQAAARSARLVEILGVGERLEAETIRAAGEWDAGADWALDGALSPRAWLVQRCPISRLAASRLVGAGRFARDNDATGEALASGELTATQAGVLAGMARGRRADYTEAEAVLLDCARALCADDFAEAARRWREIVDDHRDPPGTGTSEPQHLHVSVVGGTGVVNGELDADTTKVVRDALDLAAPPDPANGPEPPRSLAQRRADGLHDVCAAFIAAHTAMTGGPTRHGRVPVGLGVLIDHDTLAGHDTEAAPRPARHPQRTPRLRADPPRHRAPARL